MGRNLKATKGCVALVATAAALALGAAPAGADADSLDETEIHHLEFIREEEKLARDVYIVLHEEWGTAILGNILESEQRHMDAIAALLEKYGIHDPVTDDTVGVFTDPFIDSLFDGLTDLGLRSEADALLVGGFIEEFDIIDLWNAADDTDEPDIDRVYQSLYEGSYNHLYGYVGVYEQTTGGDYVSQFLGTDDNTTGYTFEEVWAIVVDHVDKGVGARNGAG